MPINESLMRSLKKRYGAKKGERMYYAMESEGHPATKETAVRKSRRGKDSKHPIRRAMGG